MGKRFVQLTRDSGDEIWFDVDEISAISEFKLNATNSTVYLKCVSSGWRVRETPKEVFEKIRRGEKYNEEN